MRKDKSSAKPKHMKEKANRGKKTGKVNILFFQTIQFKLVSSFLVPVACIVVLGVASYQTASSAITKSYMNSVEQTVNMMDQYLTLAVDTVQSTYKSYMNDSELEMYMRGQSPDGPAYRKKTTTTLNSYVTTDALISNIYFISDTQEPITTTKLEGTEAYQAFMDSAQGQVAANDKISYLMFGNECTADDSFKTIGEHYGARLVKRLKNVSAYMVVDINYKVVKDTLISLDAGEGSYVALVTCDGVEFVTENGVEIHPENNIFVGQDFYEETFASVQGTGVSEVRIEGKSYQFLYAILEGRKAMIGVLIPNQTILAQTADIKNLTMVISIFAVIIATLLGTLIARSFSKTIRDILKKLKRVAEGDLTVRVDSKRKDEFHLLTTGIARMITSMRDLITNINDVSLELAKAALQVSRSSKTFMQTSENIQTSISEIQDGVNRLDIDSEDCLTKMDGLSGKITSVSENAGQISQLTATAEECISEGIESMRELTISAKSTTEITGNVIVAIEALETKSRTISQIVEAINDIADQTNLLSLNASIEAARAGEAGKGFAVVAEEIRKLADQSLQSAGKIGEIITEIVENTGDVVAIAKQAEGIVASQESAVNTTTKSFEVIDKQVSELMAELEMITASVNDMDEDRSSTLGSIESISAVSAQAASSSSEVYKTAESQLGSITTLEQAAINLKQRSAHLTDLLRQFTL